MSADPRPLTDRGSNLFSGGALPGGVCYLSLRRVSTAFVAVISLDPLLLLAHPQIALRAIDQSGTRSDNPCG